MATQVGTAVVKLSFDGSGVKSELNKAEKSTASFGSKVGATVKRIGVALTAAFAAGTAAAIKFSKDSIEAFNTQAEAFAKLDQTARNQKWTAEAVADLKAYNSELQKTGIIGDEVAAAGQAQLGTFGLTSQSVKTLTPALNDLMAATSGYGTTTENATQMANLLGKVMTGNAGALTRYGVTLDENQKKILKNGTEAQRAATLVEVLKQNYGGFNEALAQTPQGKVTQLKNAIGDLKESFGAFLAGKGDINDFFNNLDTVLDMTINAIVEFSPQIIDGVSTLISRVSEKLPELIQQLLPVITQLMISLGTAMIESAPVFIDCAVQIIIALANAFIDNFPIIVEALAKAAPQLIGPLLAILAGKAAFGGIKHIFSNIFSKGTVSELSAGATKVFDGIGNAATTALKSLKEVLVAGVEALVEPIKTALKGIGEAIAGFFKAFADPAILLGAVMFAAAAGAIALAILMIGGAIGAIMPVLTDFLNNIIMPIAQFIVDTVLTLLDALTEAIIKLTNGAVIPLGEFLRDTFISIIEAVADVITKLTQGALIPLINTLSGAFMNIVNTVTDAIIRLTQSALIPLVNTIGGTVIGIINSLGDTIRGIIDSALNGLVRIIEAISDGFTKLGWAIRNALDGVSGVLYAFASVITAISSALVAIVSLVTGRSINYGAGYAHLFAEGGRVVGPGTSTSDSIPAMLSNGEYVIKASSAKAIGYDNLDNMNESGLIPKAITHSLASKLSSLVEEDTTTGAETNRPIVVYMTNEINNEMDAEDIGRKLMQSIRRAA